MAQELIVELYDGLEEAYQSLGLLPEKMTFVTTWSGPGFGIGTSRMVTFGPLAARVLVQ